MAQMTKKPASPAKKAPVKKASLKKSPRKGSARQKRLCPCPQASQVFCPLAFCSSLDFLCFLFLSVPLCASHKEMAGSRGSNRTQKTAEPQNFLVNYLTQGMAELYCLNALSYTFCGSEIHKMYQKLECRLLAALFTPNSPRFCP